MLLGLALVFLGVAGSFLLMGWRTWRQSTHTYEREPGAYRSEWKTRRLLATTILPNVELWPGFAKARVESWIDTTVGALIGWLAVGAVAYFIIWPPLREGLVVRAVFGGLIGFVPLASAAWCSFLLYKAARHRRQYGRAEFVMDEMPAVLGGTLSGTVYTGMSKRDRPARGLRVALKCVERTKGFHGAGPRYRRLWSAAERLRGRGQDGREEVVLTVAFDLPDDQPPSTIEKLKARVIWRLEIAAHEAKLPYEQYVEVPVFPVNRRGRESDADVAGDDARGDGW